MNWDHENNICGWDIQESFTESIASLSKEKHTSNKQRSLINKKLNIMQKSRDEYYTNQKIQLSNKKSFPTKFSLDYQLPLLPKQNQDEVTQTIPEIKNLKKLLEPYEIYSKCSLMKQGQKKLFPTEGSQSDSRYTNKLSLLSIEFDQKAAVSYSRKNTHSHHLILKNKLDFLIQRLKKVSHEHNQKQKRSDKVKGISIDQCCESNNKIAKIFFKQKSERFLTQTQFDKGYLDANIPTNKKVQSRKHHKQSVVQLSSQINKEIIDRLRQTFTKQ